MATQALTADAAVDNTRTYVSNATANIIVASLADDFSTGDEVRFEVTGTGSIIVVNDEGRRLGIVGPKSAAVVNLLATGEWVFTSLQASPVAFVADGSDAATTQALANALKAMAVTFGFMKAE